MSGKSPDVGTVLMMVGFGLAFLGLVGDGRTFNRDLKPDWQLSKCGEC